MQMDIIISFYKFVAIQDPCVLKEELQALAENLEIKGTILLATEGINGMLSGAQESIQKFESQIHLDHRFTDLEFKHSEYKDVSFRRMLVKVKKEIITMKKPIDPTVDTGNYLDPLEFKDWQDQAKDMIILDTRNDYEVALGTFKQAVDPKIKSFGEFPEWVDENLKDHKDKTIVTFCTGGIRCEKATAYMKQQGFKDVHQIDGGILKYFEATMDASSDNHWQGDCVVFDKRKAVTKTLDPSDKEICFVCLAELNSENKFLKEHPAGYSCKPCAAKMKQSHENRVERGLARHQSNLENRQSFLASQKEKYAQLLGR